MKSFVRGFMKIGNGIYQSQSASRKAVQICSRNLYRSTVLKHRCPLLNPAYRTPCVANSYNTKRAYHSEADTDLSEFLKEEVSFEEENIKKLPKINNFRMGVEGTNVKLTRDFHGENVVVEFDINENVNVDDGESIQGEVPEEEEDIPDIVSYPTFTVSITKPSGNTLLFNCNCNTGINENDDVDGDDSEEQYDLLRFDSVQVFNPVEVDKEKAYSAESENMDGELYSMLLNTLLERGIDGTFVNDLIDLSTAMEHRHYVTFLKSLGKFVKEK